VRVCEVEYTFDRGEVFYTYGEDGLDSYTETETALHLSGEGETEALAVADALSKLQSALAETLASLVTTLRECTEWMDDQEAVQAYVAGTDQRSSALLKAVASFYGKGWEWDEVNWKSQVTERSYWTVFVYDPEDSWADEEPDSTTLETLLGQAQ